VIPGHERAELVGAQQTPQRVEDPIFASTALRYAMARKIDVYRR